MLPCRGAWPAGSCPNTGRLRSRSRPHTASGPAPDSTDRAGSSRPALWHRSGAPGAQNERRRREELVVHLPVVLKVELRVVVPEVAFRVPRQLVVGTEHPQRRIGIPKLRIERVRRVVGKADDASPILPLLLLEALISIEAGLQRVRPPHLGQVERHVVRPHQVDVARERHIRRLICRRDTAAPAIQKAGNELEARAVPDRGLELCEDLVCVAIGRNDVRVRVDEWEVPETDVEAIGRGVHRDGVLTEHGTGVVLGERHPLRSSAACPKVPSRNIVGVMVQLAVAAYVVTTGLYVSVSLKPGSVPSTSFRC